MKRNLKVWSAELFTGRGRGRAIVAARSERAAAEAFRVTAKWLRNFGSEASSEEELAVARAKPGEPFVRVDGGAFEPYR